MRVNCGDFSIVNNDGGYKVVYHDNVVTKRGRVQDIIFLNDSEKVIFEAILEDIQNADDSDKKFSLVNHLIEAFI